MTLHRDLPARWQCLHCDRKAIKRNRCGTHYERYMRHRIRPVCRLAVHRYAVSGRCIGCRRERIT
jgi:hypothetical protein